MKAAIGMVGAFLAGIAGGTAAARPGDAGHHPQAEVVPDSSTSAVEHHGTGPVPGEEPTSDAAGTDTASTPADDHGTAAADHSPSPVMAPAAADPAPAGVVPERVAGALAKMAPADAGVLLSLLTTEEAIAVIDAMPAGEASRVVAAVPAPRGTELGRALLVRLSRTSR